MTATDDDDDDYDDDDDDDEQMEIISGNLFRATVFINIFSCKIG